MRSKLLRRALMAAFVVVAFAGGYAVGHRTAFARMTRLLVAETQGNLTSRIETLARLRTGDPAGAIAELENAVDNATQSLPQGQAWSELEPGLRSTLQLAKAYRTRHPPAAPRPELTALLDSIPMPDGRYCSPALQKLLLADPNTNGQ